MTALDYQSGRNRNDDSARFGNWVGWAIFLGMSWTWCIGMFLPVLLVRDYGYWAWLIFALPNVIGAAAMGFVLRDGQSEQLVANHRRALVLFSCVTIAFQVFFAGWVLRLISQHGNALWAGMIAAALGAMIAMRRWPSSAIAVAIGIFCLSCACAAEAYRSGQLTTESLTLEVPFSPSRLLPLATLCVFGFALCPYGDLTFYRARRALTAGQAKSAFATGFGIFFFAMIIFTLLYAWMLMVHVYFDSGKANRAFLLAMQVHFLVQLAFTVAVHGRELAQSSWIIALSVSAGVLLVLLANSLPWNEFDRNEFIYRLFMSFYGLFFPAYAWLCMLPTWRNPTSPSRRSLAAFASAVILAGPFYWLAFIEGKMLWVLPGLAIVLLARIFIPGRRNVVDIA